MNTQFLPKSREGNKYFLFRKKKIRKREEDETKITQFFFSKKLKTSILICVAVERE